MKVLVLGASGLLAKPVIQHFDEAGFELRLFSRSVNASMFEKPYELMQGDVFKPEDLDKAMDGCDAVHITISKVDENLSTQAIIAAAKKHDIQLISMISGCTVAEENRWFKMIDNKWKAEQTLINSSIPYMIFRPTWFFESLGFFVRNGRASLLGKQPNPYRWLAAHDMGRMITTAYLKQAARNKIFFIFGPQKLLMKDVLEKYVEDRHPEINKVSVAPMWMMRVIAFLSGNKQLKMATDLFSYFQKVQELGDASETNELLGKPETTFEKWLKGVNSNQAVLA
ncbi:MAG: NAD-dependent epimerase/dehydratase family protein [Bacteroidetes bacterium]|nr:MAG: NAD-dependent epimerase/dehydratase family protein [Bacteroidota bacterium]